MSRYQALRSIGCDPLSAGFIAFLNWMRGYPVNHIQFLNVVIEIPAPGVEASDKASHG